MRHVGDAAERLLAGSLVLQVHREVPEGLVAEDLGLATRDRDNSPAVVEEAVHDRSSDKSTGSGDKHGVGHRRLPRRLVTVSEWPFSDGLAHITLLDSCEGCQEVRTGRLIQQR